MSRFRLIGGGLLASAGARRTARRRRASGRRRLHEDGEGLHRPGDRAGHQLGRPDHRSEGAGQEAGRLRLGRPAQRRRQRRRRRRAGSGQGARLGLPHPRRPGLGPGAHLGADPGDRAEARRHHSRHHRRRRAGADHRAGGRGRASRSSAGTPGPAPGKIEAVPGVFTNITTDPARGRQGFRPLCRGRLRAARPA